MMCLHTATHTRAAGIYTQTQLGDFVSTTLISTRTRASTSDALCTTGVMSDDDDGVGLLIGRVVVQLS
jgi:hypothetical protein